MQITFEKLDEKATIPEYATAGSAGADLRACLDEPIMIATGQRKLVPTGLKMKIPFAHEVQIRPRSGLALKQGVTVLNSPGTIDSDYRGPIGIILYNTSESSVTIEHGDRIAQMVVSRVEMSEMKEGKVDDDTDRGNGGFGSTGDK